MEAGAGDANRRVAVGEQEWRAQRGVDERLPLEPAAGLFGVEAGEEGAAEEGERACPFTRAYWEFLERNRERLAGNQRMAMQLRNLARRGVKGS